MGDTPLRDIFVGTVKHVSPIGADTENDALYICADIHQKRLFAAKLIVENSSALARTNL